MDTDTQSAPAATRARRTTAPKSHPYFTQTVALQSLHAQQVFERGFNVCASSFFMLAIVLPRLATVEQAREAQALADERFNTGFSELRTEAARLAQLADSHGIDMASMGMAYTAPQDLAAQITSPNAMRYVALIREFDKLVASFDALFLSDVMPVADYSQNLYDWKRKLLRLAGDIRNISRRAMAGARRKDVPVPPEATNPNLPPSDASATNAPDQETRVDSPAESDAEHPSGVQPEPAAPRNRRAGAHPTAEATMPADAPSAG